MSKTRREQVSLDCAYRLKPVTGRLLGDFRRQTGGTAAFHPPHLALTARRLAQAFQTCFWNGASNGGFVTFPV
jgi:hypothetical protein